MDATVWRVWQGGILKGEDVLNCSSIADFKIEVAFRIGIAFASEIGKYKCEKLCSWVPVFEDFQFWLSVSTKVFLKKVINW